MSPASIATPVAAAQHLKRTGWSEQPIAVVARPVERIVRPVPGQAYRQIGVRLWGQGAYERGGLDGGDTKYGTLNRVAADDIIVNKIWARNGSVSVVPPALDGCVCSSEFPLFEPIRDRLEPRWFYWLTRTRWFWAQCDQHSRGTSGKNRIRAESFLQITIPVPPLPEQRRIVAKLDALSAKTGEAQALRALSAREIDLLTRAESRRVFASLDSYPSRPLRQVCREIIDCLHSNPVYSESGVPTLRSPDVGWGVLYLDRARTTDEREYQRRVGRGEPRAGDLVVVREGGGTGRAGLAEPNQRFSLGQRVMLLRPTPELVDPRFLLQQWLSPRIQDDHIAALTKGSASPHLNISSIREFPMVTPPLEVQRLVVSRLDAFRAAVGKAASVHVRIAAELDALLPAALDRAFKGEL